MTERRRQIRGNLAAFALLFAVSLYRQLSLRFWPGDPLRTWILYAGYVVLIASWAVSIKSRITTGSVRFFLLADAAVMLYGLTIRFIQDTWWQDNIALMRVSGLFVEATILPMLTMGFFASLGTGRADTYRISAKWYSVLIPVAVMTVLNMLDEQLHAIALIRTIYEVPHLPQLSSIPDYELTEEELKSGISFPEAYRALRRFCDGASGMAVINPAEYDTEFADPETCTKRIYVEKVKLPPTGKEWKEYSFTLNNPPDRHLIKLEFRTKGKRLDLEWMKVPR